MDTEWQHLPRVTPMSGASNGRVAVSTLGPGCAYLTAFIAYCPNVPASSAAAVHPLRANSLRDPALAGSMGLSDSAGEHEHTGQGSLPICAANAGPIWPHSFGLARDIWLKKSVGTGCIARWLKTYNIQHSK